MVKRGDVIENPITSERLEFLQTAEDTDGSLLQFDLTVKPNGIVAAPHIHPIQEERLLVQSGTLRLGVGAQEMSLVSGQVGLVARGSRHVLWNGGDDELKLRVEFRPALQMEDILVSLFELARVGRTNRMGVPNLLQVAVMIKKHPYELYLAKPSINVQKILFWSIAWIGTLIGYKSDYPYRSLTPGMESMPVDSELSTVPIEGNHRH